MSTLSISAASTALVASKTSTLSSTSKLTPVTTPIVDVDYSAESPKSSTAPSTGQVLPKTSTSVAGSSLMSLTSKAIKA